MKQMTLSLGLLLGVMSLHAQDVAQTVGERYIECVKNFSNSETLPALIEALFEENVHFYVNSSLICTNRLDVLQEIKDVADEDRGFKNVEVFEYIECPKKSKSIVYWHVTYENDLKETVATFLCYNDQEKVTKIDVVYGKSGSHQWQPKA